jgi:hypothetical protein
VNIRNQWGTGLEWSAGVGYGRVHFNYGTFNITSPDGPEVIGSFEAYDLADAYSAGAALFSWVEFSAGVTFKHIVSHLAPDAQGNVVSVSADAYDYGFLLRLPVTGTIARLRGEPLRFSPSLRPVCDVTIGASRQNLGTATLDYPVSSGPEPLPHLARLGIAIGAGVDWDTDALTLRAVALEWSIESNDLLVRRFVPPLDSLGNAVGPGWEYEGGFGRIQPFHELIGGHANSRTQRKTGWEIELFESFILRGGRMDYGSAPLGLHRNTHGFGFRLSGFMKAIIASGAPLADDGVVGYLVRHLDLRYDHAQYEADDPLNPLHRTTFDAASATLSF